LTRSKNRPFYNWLICFVIIQNDVLYLGGVCTPVYPSLQSSLGTWPDYKKKTTTCSNYSYLVYQELRQDFCPTSPAASPLQEKNIDLFKSGQK